MALTSSCSCILLIMYCRKAKSALGFHISAAILLKAALSAVLVVSS